MAPSHRLKFLLLFAESYVGVSPLTYEIMSRNHAMQQVRLFLIHHRFQNLRNRNREDKDDCTE